MLEDEAVARAIQAKPMIYDPRTGEGQLRWLYQLAAMAPDGPAVECGVYVGGSFVCMAGAREGRGELFAVDNWKSKNRGRFYVTLERFGLVEDTTVWGVETWMAGQAFDDGTVAFCFIDAAHSLAGGFLKDLAHWWEKIMPGGILAFHDYDVWKPPVCVKDFVDPWQKHARWEELGCVGALIAFRRPADG